MHSKLRALMWVPQRDSRKWFFLVYFMAVRPGPRNKIHACYKCMLIFKRTTLLPSLSILLRLEHTDLGVFFGCYTAAVWAYDCCFGWWTKEVVCNRKHTISPVNQLWWECDAVWLFFCFRHREPFLGALVHEESRLCRHCYWQKCEEIWCWFACTSLLGLSATQKQTSKLVQSTDIDVYGRSSLLRSMLENLLEKI